ncbi:hypothetical protein HK103_003315 [Boothiomyces macroporosus]|uniref:Serine aminopeptidase S33 domain-containing protein n=1 Tax=Boothiomyces macroporosus TaxID=261099 RepID=A0AAD5UMH5_9FUNG|nr:hypothetical protein HK103_003315 [Boothiomyces macroporosus]
MLQKLPPVLQGISIQTFNRFSNKTLVYIPGYNSTFENSIKAKNLITLSSMEKINLVLYDHYGHGKSIGNLKDATLQRWVDDTKAIFDSIQPQQNVYIVASSMGTWIGLLAANDLFLENRCKGFVGLGSAYLFTRRILDSLTDSQLEEIKQSGVFRKPSKYSKEPYEYSYKLLEDSLSLTIQNYPVGDCHVELIHGLHDTDVPYSDSETLAQNLIGNNGHM